MESIESLSCFYLGLPVGLLADRMKTLVARTKVDRFFHPSICPPEQLFKDWVSQIPEKGMDSAICHTVLSIFKVPSIS